MTSDRQAVALAIADVLSANRDRLKAEFLSGPDGIRSCVLDDVFDPETMLGLNDRLPSQDIMLRRTDFRERKFVTAELSDLNDSIREVIMGLASAPVAAAVSDITGLPGLEQDKELYNGGLTMMVKDDFMMPHLDNSHDRTRSRRRAVVVLFYLTPWRERHGGALKLWSPDQRSVVRSIEYRPNRLVMLETTDHSWHSVEPITGPARRVNVTTYFYQGAVKTPVRLTRYAGWPGRPVSQAMATADFAMRTAALKVGLDRFVKKRHVLSRPAVPVGSDTL